MPRTRTDPAIEELETDLLLEAVYRQYGYDFRAYARSSLRRRLHNIMRSEQIDTLSGLQERVLHHPDCLERFVLGISVNVSTMFRDPAFFVALRRVVVPMLRTYPFIRIWQAGCSMGEEVYSMAILLEEEGLYDRCRIYATDMNEAVLRKAREGIYPIDSMQKQTENYLQAGGARSFSDYYTAAYDHAIMRPSLRANVVFSQHNLVIDGPFNEFNVILCRNVMIYFNAALQDRVHELILKSLTTFGVLGIGSHETLQFTAADYYEPLAQSVRLYRRVA